MFSDFLDEFLENLFNNIGFIDLLEDYWIKIDLYPNWVDRISSKTKIYKARIYNREIINKIYRKLEA
jgi:hypothetical protein